MLQMQKTLHNYGKSCCKNSKQIERRTMPFVATSFAAPQKKLYITMERVRKKFYITPFKNKWSKIVHSLLLSDGQKLSVCYKYNTFSDVCQQKNKKTLHNYASSYCCNCKKLYITIHARVPYNLMHIRRSVIFCPSKLKKILDKPFQT